MFDLPPVDRIVIEALAEDLGVDASVIADGSLGQALLAQDVTTAAVLAEDAWFTGVITARESCTIAGLPVAAAVFERLSSAADLFSPIDFFPLLAEGARVTPGTPVAEIEGLALAVLCAERTALDFLMILSGMATETSLWVDAAAGRFDVCDTRKTLPGLRALSKYAVKVGGGTNHRAGLYDMVLVKDNHLLHADSITEAVWRAREAHPDLLVEIEADTREQAVEAVLAGADLVLLDNMDDAALASAVDVCREAAAELGSPVLLEASGGIGLDRIESLAASGVDRVSSSRLTLAPPVDFGLDES